MCQYATCVVGMLSLFFCASVSWGQQGQAPAAMKIDSTALGNVFYVDQPVVLSIDTAGDAVQWSVRDAWGVQVLSAAQTITTHPTTLTLPLNQLGYFEVSITARRGGQVMEQGHTRLAVLTRFDLAAIKDSPFGTMTHFAQKWDTDLIALIAAGGIKHVRDEAYWAHVEKIKDQFDFSEFDPYMNALAANHITSLTPLTFGNPLYDRSDQGADWCIAPYSQVGFNGYDQYARKTIEHFGAQIHAVEIWNEYNGGFAPGPADGKAEVYAEMIKHVYPAIKKANPDMMVLGCSTIGLPMDWIETIFKHGGLDAMDGISIHPYGYLSPPEWMDQAIPPLKELIRRYNHGKDKPIWATEQGWYAYGADRSSRSNPLTEMTKARYLVRVYTLLQSVGVEQTYWYLFRDYDQFGTMGLVGRPDDPAGRYAPHQAFVAYAVMTRQLSDAKFVARDDTVPAIRSYAYDKAGQTLRVLWSTEPQNVALGSDQPLTVTDMMGRVYQVHPIEGAVHLVLSESPVYVAGPVKSITPDQTLTLQIPAEAAIGEPLRLHLAVPAKLVAQHLMVHADGRQENLTAPGGQIDIDLPPSRNPDERWTVCELRSDGQTILLGSALTQIRDTVVLDQFPNLADLNTLTLPIFNVSQHHALKLRSLQWSLDAHSHQQTMTKVIAPGQLELTPLSVEGLAPWTIYSATIDATFDDLPSLNWKGQVSYNPLIKRTITVDGDLSDWKDIEGIDLSLTPFEKLAAAHTGDADLSGHVWLCWDEQYLYFAAQIRDDIFSQDHTGFTVWKGDNIQLGFNSGMPWPGGQIGSGRQELGLTLTPLGPQFYRFGGDGKKFGVNSDVPLIIKREGEFTIYECAIPWSQLDTGSLERGTFSFGIFVNDSDGKGRKGYKRWADIKNPAAFQPCYLQR